MEEEDDDLYEPGDGVTAGNQNSSNNNQAPQSNTGAHEDEDMEYVEEEEEDDEVCWLNEHGLIIAHCFNIVLQDDFKIITEPAPGAAVEPMYVFLFSRLDSRQKAHTRTDNLDTRPRAVSLQLYTAMVRPYPNLRLPPSSRSHLLLRYLPQQPRNRLPLKGRDRHILLFLCLQ